MAATTARRWRSRRAHDPVGAARRPADHRARPVRVLAWGYGRCAAAGAGHPAEGGVLASPLLARQAEGGRGRAPIAQAVRLRRAATTALLALGAAACSGITTGRDVIAATTWERRGELVGDYLYLYCTRAAARERLVFLWGVEKTIGPHRVEVTCAPEGR
jgi:hypothetical protein